VAIYVALLLALRLFGKREVGQFTLYDLVFILLVANALQPAITGPDTSVGGGLVLVVALVGTNYIVGKLDNLPRFHRLFTAAPAVIVKDGKYLLDGRGRGGDGHAGTRRARPQGGAAGRARTGRHDLSRPDNVLGDADQTPNPVPPPSGLKPTLSPRVPAPAGFELRANPQSPAPAGIRAPPVPLFSRQEVDRRFLELSGRHSTHVVSARNREQSR